MKLEDVKVGQVIKVSGPGADQGDGVERFHAYTFRVRGIKVYPEGNVLGRFYYREGSFANIEVYKDDTIELIEDVLPYPEYNAVKEWFRSQYPDAPESDIQRWAGSRHTNSGAIRVIRALAERWGVEPK